jgi:hypothetical protein
VTFNSAVKRCYSPEQFDDLDSENVDPAVFSSKKSKNLDGNPVKAPKAAQFALNPARADPLTLARPIITPKRLDAVRSVNSTRKAAAPVSAPAAGRSPKSKRVGILSRRRVSSSPFTRVDPPSFGLGNGLPFSIDAALSGTVSSYQPEPQAVAVPTIEESMPGGWMFNIHEDTPDEEMGNLMEFSTQTLDISDDESKLAERDERGKENIPPVDYPSMPTAVMTGYRPATRKDLMTDEPRAPLGDLDAAEFYAEGCDANSYIIIPVEKGHEPAPEPVVTPVEADEAWKEVLAHAENIQKANAEAALALAAQTELPIEVWESESAKGDESPLNAEVTTVPLEENAGVVAAAETVCDEAVL